MSDKSFPEGRVLIVEDDQAICGAIADMLEGTGLTSLCVHTDEAAYSELSTSTAFRAIVLDINLGQGTTGFDVARFARQIIPQIAVAYVSGAAPPRSFDAFGVPRSTLLEKPFTVDRLLDALRQQMPA